MLQPRFPKFLSSRGFLGHRGMTPDLGKFFQLLTSWTSWSEISPALWVFGLTYSNQLLSYSGELSYSLILCIQCTVFSCCNSNFYWIPVKKTHYFLFLLILFRTHTWYCSSVASCELFRAYSWQCLVVGFKPGLPPLCNAYGASHFYWDNSCS